MSSIDMHSINVCRCMDFSRMYKNKKIIKNRGLIVSSSQRVDDLYLSVGEILIELFIFIVFPDDN